MHWRSLLSLLIAALLLNGCIPQTPASIPSPTLQALPGSTAASTLPPPPAPGSTAAHTQSPPGPASTAALTLPLPPTPAPTETPPPHKSVVLISWDGAGADKMQQLMQTGHLPHFAALAAQGVQAEYALSIDPTLTAAAQNAIATGSYPSRTGIVSNSYHNPTDSFYWYRRGYDELLDQAEPVWVTASRQGLTSAAVFFNGGSPAHPGQTADYTIGYGIQDAYSKQISVALDTPADGWQGTLPQCFSPPLEGSFTIQEVSRVYLYLCDQSDDNQQNYDAVYLNTKRSLGAETPLLHTGDWSSLVLLPSSLAGADFLIQRIQADAAAAEVTLFYSGVYHNTASPRHLQEALNQQFGFFPSGADSYAMEHGWISAEENLYLLKRQARWMAEVAAWVYRTYQPDLMYTWQDAFDAAGHAFFMQDERQTGYTPELASQQQEYYLQAAQAADEALGIMLQALDLQHATLMLVSDHGMAPIHSVVYVNTILERAGLLVLDNRNYVVVDKSRAFAVASGGAVHIYINLQGHEKNGFVTQEEYPALQQQIVDLFASQVDPASGLLVFQRVLPKEDLASLHLDHLNSGDVFAQAVPGYHLDGWRGNDVVFEPALFYGQHGYDSTLPEMHALFIAAGAGVGAQGKIIPPVSVVDYAPTIAHLLGITPAPSVDGAVIPFFASAR